ncbi:MAG TPA: putative glycoside hydrolase, partial [Sphingomicrobium sp.]
ESNGDVLLLFTLKVADAPDSAAIALRCAGSNCGGRVPVSLPVSTKFVRYGLPLKCLAAAGGKLDKVTAPFVLETRGKADYSLSEVRLGTDADKVLACK